jgi:hypothetical protein
MELGMLPIGIASIVGWIVESVGLLQPYSSGDLELQKTAKTGYHLAIVLMCSNQNADDARLLSSLCLLEYHWPI